MPGRTPKWLTVLAEMQAQVADLLSMCHTDSGCGAVALLPSGLILQPAALREPSGTRRAAVPRAGRE